MFQKGHKVTLVFGLICVLMLLAACQGRGGDIPEQTIEAMPSSTMIIQATPTETPQPTITPTLTPACYQKSLPENIITSYAIQGWMEFARSAGFSVRLFYIPDDCPPDSLERDAQVILNGELLEEDQVGLVVLSPVETGSLGELYQHLIQHEYWQMGPEDYPAVLAEQTGVDKNLVFLRLDELNGDNTIIGSPLIVMTSLAEHEYIHIAQSRNNPDLAQMVWNDREYQAFIEGYANIGNASSQRYYFETKAAIEILQNLDLMNRNGLLQDKIITALESMNFDSNQFKEMPVPVYDRHIQAFFLRVGGQAYLDALDQGEISPYLLFTRAGSGDLTAFELLQAALP